MDDCGRYFVGACSRGEDSGIRGYFFAFSVAAPSWDKAAMKAS